MDNLCFGTFAKTMQSALQKPNSNQAVAELLLGLIVALDSKKLYTMLPKKVSALFNFKEDVQEDIVSLASTSKIIDAMPKSFSNQVINYLVPNQVDDLIENIRKLIINDRSISPIKRDELLLTAKKENLPTFLSDVFLYALNRTNKQAETKDTDVEFGVELTPSIPALLNVDDIDIDIDDFFSHVPAKEFINREKPRQLFYDALNDDEPLKKNVIMYYGIGGIGKSSLVKNLRDYAREHNTPYSFVDFDHPELRTPYKALNELKKNLNVSKQNVMLPHFDLAMVICFIKHNPGVSYAEIGFPNEISRHVHNLVQSTNAGLYETVLGLTERIYDKFTSTFGLAANLKQHLKKLEEMSAHEVEKALSTFFAIDLHRYMVICNIKKCVLFFDTYELLWENGRTEANQLNNDAWVRKMAEKLPNVIFVLSGREKIQWRLDNGIWDDKVHLEPIDILSEIFAREYLTACKIEDKGIQDGIIAAAKGHPYYLDLCVDTYYKLKDARKNITEETFGNGFQEIQECFLRSLSKSEIETLKVLSIPRFYDIEIFDYLANRFNTGYSTVSINNFNAFSFIKHDNEINKKCIIHVLMRDEIGKLMAPEIKKAINSSMISFYEKKLSNNLVYADDLRYYFSELLFHLESAMTHDEFLDNIERKYMVIVKSLQLSGETQYILDQFLHLFNENRTKLGGTEFFAVMADMIHLSGSYKEAVAIITEYLSAFNVNKIAQDGYCLNLYIRRTHHRMFYVPLQSLRNDLNEIIDAIDSKKYVQQYCEILFMLGAHIYLPGGDLDKGRHYLRQMMKIAKQHSLYGLLCRGLRKYAELLCEEGRLSLAEKICTAALRVADEKNLRRYAFYLHCVWGEIKRLSGKTTDALKLFEDAMPIAKDLGIKGWVGHVYLAMGNCYSDLGRYDEAFLQYEQSRELYAAIEQKWGEINLEVAYQRALILSSNNYNNPKLYQLESDAKSMGYNVLAKKINSLLAGNQEIIRFEYL